MRARGSTHATDGATRPPPVNSKTERRDEPLQVFAEGSVLGVWSGYQALAGSPVGYLPYGRHVAAMTSRYVMSRREASNHQYCRAL